MLLILTRPLPPPPLPRCLVNVNKTLEVNDTDRIIYLNLVFKLITEIYRSTIQIYVDQIQNLSQVTQSLRIVSNLRMLSRSSEEFLENVFRGCVCSGVGASKIEHHNFINYKGEMRRSDNALSFIHEFVLTLVPPSPPHRKSTKRPHLHILQRNLLRRILSQRNVQK